MRLTGKQAHVLAHLERVVRRPYKLNTLHTRPRFDLDGWECTQQITALVVKKKVVRLPGGALARREESKATQDSVVATLAIVQPQPSASEDGVDLNAFGRGWM